MAQPMQQQPKPPVGLKDQQIDYGSVVIRPSYKTDDELKLVRWKIDPPKVEVVPVTKGHHEVLRVFLFVLLFIGVALTLNYGLNWLGLGWLVHG